jgi:hypothetical protein
MSLSKKQLKDVCCLGLKNLQCRYLEEDSGDSGDLIYICKKKSPDKKIIDSEITDFLNMLKIRGQDPKQQTVALGDNCQGFMPFKNKTQGYDIEK